MHPLSPWVSCLDSKPCWVLSQDRWVGHLSVTDSTAAPACVGEGGGSPSKLPGWEMGDYPERGARGPLRKGRDGTQEPT